MLLNRFLMLSFVIILSTTIYPQSNGLFESEKDIVIDGSENPDLSNSKIITKNTVDRIDAVQGNYFIYDFHNITNRKTGYDLQSNASPQQVWYDLNNNYLHAVFTNSQELNPWADRTSLYFGSTDLGITWYELGGVPVNGHSGFPAIY